MKKRIRRLRLERETLRNLTQDHLALVVAGCDTQGIDLPGITRFDSCNWHDETLPQRFCASCAAYGCG